MFTLAVLVRRRSACGVTVSVAVIVEVLAPTVVVNDPTGIEFANPPAELAVTTTDKEQLDPGGITLPTDNVAVPSPAVAAGVALAQVVVTAGVEAFTKPTGY